LKSRFSEIFSIKSEKKLKLFCAYKFLLSKLDFIIILSLLIFSDVFIVVLSLEFDSKIKKKHDEN